MKEAMVNKAQRITALERALAAIEVAIARVEAALPAAGDTSRRERLNAQLATLKSERFNIGVQLATCVPRKPQSPRWPMLRAQRLKTLSAELDNAIVDRAVVFRHD